MNKHTKEVILTKRMLFSEIGMRNIYAGGREDRLAISYVEIGTCVLCRYPLVAYCFFAHAFCFDRARYFGESGTCYIISGSHEKRFDMCTQYTYGGRTFG